MKKQFFAAFLFLFLLQPGLTVQKISPNQKNVIGESNESIVSSSPFKAVKNGSDVLVSPDFSFRPRTYNQTVEYVNHTEFYVLDVVKVQNWTVNQRSLSKTASVGSTGQSKNLNVSLKGNSPATLDFKITGNISQYISTSGFTVYPGITKKIVLSHQIPKNTQFGKYTGRLQIKGGNQTQNITLKYQLQDNIKPVIQKIKTPNFQATKPQTFTVKASDNLKIQEINAEILTEKKVKKPNKTVLKNVTTEKLTFQKQSNTDKWKATPKREQTGTFYIKINVTDTAGNKIQKRSKYKVQKLDSIKILNSNFIFDAVKPGEKARRPIINLETNTKATIILRRLTHKKEKATVDLGILKPGDEKATGLNSEGSKVKIQEKGTYKLVIESNKEGDDPEGTLEIKTIPQHKNLENISFEASIVNPEYPEPAQYSIGSFKGRIEFLDNDSAIHRGVKFEAVNRNVESCKGVDKWNKCIPGFDLGEIDEVVKEKNKWKNLAKSYKDERNWAVFGFLIILVIMEFKKRRNGLVMSRAKWPKDEIGKIWKDFEEEVPA